MKTRVLALLGLLLAAAVAGAQQEIRTTLQFETEGQPLFGEHAGSTELVDIDLPFFTETIDPTTVGEIRRVTEEVPLATLQDIWQEAIDTCMAQSYTVPVVGTKISPTESECISGKVSRKYCVAPPELGWAWYCPSPARKTYTHNVGAGIGPEPTQPADRPFDVGAIVTYSADVAMGVRGVVTFDEGSVDVSFAGEAVLTTDVAEAEPGDIVTIDSAWIMDADTARMVSRYPNIDFALGSYVFADISATAEYAAPDLSNGEQIRTSTVLYDQASLDSDLENVGADGIVEFADTEWFGLNISPAGLEVRVLEAGATLVDGSTLFNKRILFPFAADGVPRPPGTPAFELASATLLSPKLDTPAIDGFNCGDCLEPPLRHYVDFDGRIVNTTPVGDRKLIDGIYDEDGLKWPTVTEGLQDGDFFRFDLDVDSIALTLGTPLGVNFEGPPVKLPTWLAKDKSIGPAAGVDLELIDMDVAGFFSADQELIFDGRVSVVLEFDKAVDLRLEGEADFTARQSVTLLLGDSLEFVQPEGGVTVTPVYSARHNQFVNDTEMLLTLAFQQTMGQVRFYGLGPDMLAAAFSLPQNFAIQQLTPQLGDPLAFYQSQPEAEALRAYGLGGFADTTGQSFAVREAGSSGGTGGGSGGGTGGGSGGGGAVLLMPLLLLAASRARRLSLRSESAGCGSRLLGRPVVVDHWRLVRQVPDDEFIDLRDCPVVLCEQPGYGGDVAGAAGVFQLRADIAEGGRADGAGRSLVLVRKFADGFGGANGRGSVQIHA